MAATPKRKDITIKDLRDEDLIGTTDASHILRISTETVRAFVARGLLEAVPISGRLGYRRSDVERLAAERRKPPKAAPPKPPED